MLTGEKIWSLLSLGGIVSFKTCSKLPASATGKFMPSGRISKDKYPSGLNRMVGRPARADSRPTVVQRVSDDTFILFSGKISTCVDSSKELYCKLLNF